MEITELRERFGPAVTEIIEQCQVTDGFVDKDLFRVYIATIWGNAVLEPGKSGLTEADLPSLHDYLNEEIPAILGAGEDVTSIYEYLTSKVGEDSLERLQVGARHREFIAYFARLIQATQA
ncbi:MAG: hypothetical protein ACFHX7_01330 [Pseudomonadota bacterium]